MPRLVVSGVSLLRFRHHHGPSLGAHHDLVLGELELIHTHQTQSTACSKERCLVNQIGKVCPRESRCSASDLGGIDILRQRHLAHVDFQNLFPAPNIGQANHYLPVETPGSQQRRIQHVWPVGRGNHDHAVIQLKAVHFHQQLVQSLFAFIVTAAQTRAPVSAHGVDFVNKDDAGRLLFRLLKHVSNTGRAHTHKHLDEVGSRDREERHLCFTRNSLG